MEAKSKRATVYLDPKLHRAKIKSAQIERTISELIEDDQLIVREIKVGHRRDVDRKIKSNSNTMQPIPTKAGRLIGSRYGSPPHTNGHRALL